MQTYLNQIPKARMTMIIEVDRHWTLVDLTSILLWALAIGLVLTEYGQALVEVGQTLHVTMVVGLIFLEAWGWAMSPRALWRK